jgi:DMSO reductase anchor subunit
MLGVCGLSASAAIYLVPARPSWNSRHTVADFLLTAAILGPLFLSAIGVDHAALPIAAATAAAAQLFNRTVRVFGMIASDEFELQASARLLSNDFRKLFMLRLSLLLLGGVAAPLAGYPLVAFPVAAVGELIGRYLFFVSVVPKNMAMGFFGQSWDEAA